MFTLALILENNYYRQNSILYLYTENVLYVQTIDLSQNCLDTKLLLKEQTKQVDRLFATHVVDQNHHLGKTLAMVFLSDDLDVTFARTEDSILKYTHFYLLHAYVSTIILSSMKSV